MSTCRCTGYNPPGICECGLEDLRTQLEAARAELAEYATWRTDTQYETHKLKADLAAARVATETAERERDEWRNQAALDRDRYTATANELSDVMRERDQHRDREAHKHRLMVEAWGERDQAQANLKDITEKVLRAEGRVDADEEALALIQSAAFRHKDGDMGAGAFFECVWAALASAEAK